MSHNRRLLIAGACLFSLLLLLGCVITLDQSTPIVVTQEVTRVVVATPTQTPMIIQRFITVTVVVEATSAIPDFPPSAHTPEVQPSPVPEAQSSPVVEDGLDNPEMGLVVLSEVAETMLSEGIHTLRLMIDLSVPIEAIIRDQQQVDESLTRLVTDQLSDYDIQGNFIVDISLDDLAQQRWVIQSLGGINGLMNEEILELRQNGDMIWERPTGGEWSQRTLLPDETILPLGNSLITIDAYSHAINLSDLMIDALRPFLLLSGDRERLAEEYGWTTLTSDTLPDTSFLHIMRERILPSSNNLGAVTSSLANSGVSALVDPASITNGFREFTSFEQAWLTHDDWFVDHSQIEVRGKGLVEFVYAFQSRVMEGTVTLGYLPQKLHQ